MRHIINLIVPSYFSERSTIILQLKDLLSQYKMLDIADFQRQFKEVASEGESEAWRTLWIAALQADQSMIVSCGASENLQMVLDRLWRAPGTNIVTVIVENHKKSTKETVAWIIEQLPEDFR